MKIDIIGSLIITLILMLITYIFHLDFFGCIFLMIVAFMILNYRNRLLGHWYNFINKFKRKSKRKNVKSAYEFIDLEE
jgi:hypothetical protein